MSKKKPFTRYLLLLLTVMGFGFHCFSQSVAVKPTSAYAALHVVAEDDSDGLLQQSRSLQSVLASFEEKYKVFLSYDLEVVGDKLVDARKVEEAENKSNLEEVLDTFLKPLNLDYRRVKENYYVIFPKVADAKEVKKINNVKPQNGSSYPSLAKSGKMTASLNFMGPVRQYEQNITGKVTEQESGDGLPGVNVVVKGTTTGTVTDMDGNYSIIVSDEVNTLVFSSIGYITQEVAVNGRTVINIVLNEDVQSLKEVVVVGYGVQRKSEVTGSVGVVSGEVLEAQPSFNALQSLRGKISGVNVYTNSGSPTGSNRVIIRGIGTINASSEPLYVVDGVVMTDIETMNPNDIESIEVLKDASSAAIYGSRGANGVILVTTKRGSAQPGVVVEYTGDISISRIARKIDAMDAQEFMEVQRIGYENAPLFNEYPPGEEPQMDLSDRRIFDEQGNPIYDTDWQDEATRTAISNNHQLSIRSSSENSSFGAFLNYTDREGVFLNSYMKRASIKLVYDANPTEWLNVGANLTTYKTWANNVTETGGGFHASRAMLEVPSIFPVKWPDGSWTNSTQIDGFTFEGQPNPVHRLLEEERLNNGTRIFGNTYLEFNLAPHLTLRTQFGIDNLLEEERYYAPTDMITVGFPDGNAGISNAETMYWQNENFLTYINDFGPHRINAILGASWQQQIEKGNGMSARGFSNDFFNFNNIGAASTHNPSSSYANDWTMNSYFTRVSYTFKDTYTATFTGRTDGSSRFGENNKYGFFPSGGISWLISNEEFMGGADAISHLRLRTSYGITGNTEIGLFQSLATIGSGTILLGGQRVSNSFVQRIPNPDLEWEKTKQFDVGVEVGLFNEIISLELDYYYKLTEDLILGRPIPTSTGFGTITDNIGSVSNKGIDFMLTTRNMSSENFLWTTTLNFNYNKNKVESLGANDEDIFPGPNWVAGSQTILRVGEPVSSFWGYERLGTWSTDEEAGAAEVGAIPGEAKRSVQKTIIGNGLPDLTGSFINRFNFRNFDATIDLQFSYGADIMQQTLATAEDRQGLTSGIATQLYDAWTPDNQNTMIQQIRHTVLSGQNLQPDSHWIADGSYLRGNLIALGYTFDQNILSSLGLDQFRINASVQNAFVIFSKDFKGFDPESSTWNDSNFGQNIFFYEYPKPRTFTLGVNARF